MYNFPKNFSHIGILEFELETKQNENKSIQNMVLLFNNNYLTAEEAFDMLKKNEFSEYMVAMPKNVFNGVFKNAGFGGSLCGIVS